MMASKDTDPFGFTESAKLALEQTHQAMDTYFDFLKKSISSFPSGGTEIGDRWKEESLLNVTAFQELVKRLSAAGSLEEALRIQAAFMHSQLNRLGKQALGRHIRKRLTTQIKSARSNRLTRRSFGNCSCPAFINLTLVANSTVHSRAMPTIS
jgi:hypothetical protein